MFGFPFFTSLIVVLAGVIVVSLIANKGLAKRKQAKLEENTLFSLDDPKTSH